ncbi:hypothetical protein [Nevskia ramosa]|uniref:hypothetical protein n=1 Tax=Nevskia ramosa TaxID=64002 RepID=UPI003D09D493
MMIALDYDLTYTRDPKAWDEVVRIMTVMGHSFVCVTGRDQPPRASEPRIPMPIVCAGDELKSVAAVKAGYFVDVWIDDCPGTIERSVKLDFAS